MKIKASTKIAPQPRPEVRQAVKDLLTRSLAFAQLPPKTQAQIARDTALVADYLAQGIEKVDFPDFVSSLIEGVFQAIVNASIEQMEAYGKLVAAVTNSINMFRDENVKEEQGRDYLVERFPKFFQISIPKETPVRVKKRKLASSRQQLLATMVLMGINRIVVTQGTIRAKVRF